MKHFSYEARDQASDKVVKATIQADSERAAARLLAKQGFIVLSLREQDGPGGFLSRLSGRITTKDKIVYTRQLATLVGAGLPLSQSLHTVTEQTQNKRLQSISQDIASAVVGGRSLSESFAKHPKVFSEVFIALIAAGELSGTLDEALQRIADQQEKDAAVVSKIRGALTYPAIVLVVILGVMAFMLFTVVPQVQNLYKDLGQELPFLTKVMVGVSSFATSYWWVIIIAIVALVYFAVQYVKTERGTIMKDNFKIKMPVFGKMFSKLYMARFARTGQTLLSTGVSMLDMLKVTARAINNVVIEKSVSRAAEKVQGGKPLSASLQVEPVILPLVPQMIKIGEQSGKVDDMMGKVAQVYENELEEEIRTISTAIEPILMVVLAIVAGAMIAAILLPIYGLVNNINV